MQTFPPEQRKCLKHREWIKVHKVQGVKIRYCPMCHREEMLEKAKVFKEAGTLPPNVKIGSL